MYNVIVWENQNTEDKQDLVSFKIILTIEVCDISPSTTVLAPNVISSVLTVKLV